MKFYLSILLLSSTVFSQNLHQFVNPMIGTGGHGHTYPGATVPFGMVQLSPDTRIDDSWDGCSGYHYSDSVIYGFSHTHLNGTGVSDFGDIMLMPTMGEAELNKNNYCSSFSHQNEKASAGFYSVKLDKYNIDVALTTSTRVGFHQYKFNQSGKANIILDLNHRDALISGEIRVIDSQTIDVLRRSQGWARDQYVYARISFSRPMQITKINNNAFAPAKPTDKTFAGSILAMAFSTDVKAGETIKVKVALSPTGFEGAKNNSTEIRDWNFNKVKQSAEKLWDAELSKIQIKSTDKQNRIIFYTALYHTMIQPNIAQDIDGKYRGRDQEIHIAKDFDYYTVFSLWDTFRAAHPLYTLIDKKRTSDFINTFLRQYEQGGRLPVWELASNETDCMIGYHSVSVIADAMSKGIKGFNYDEAFEAAKHSAMLNHLGLDAYKKNGFISIDDEHENVSKTLEYAYDDWCIAQMAAILGKSEDYKYFMNRSQNWKNLFDPAIGFIRPKRNGGWDKPFDPKEVSNNYTEGNGWQYTFFVPQDISGMIAAYGGPSKFEAKLDEMFAAESATTGREQVDITGLIGQYAHGNEPSHDMAYLYNFIGKPEKTNAKIDFILHNFYKNSPDGLIGNEDCGQMSAWYVLSSLGLYAVTPGKPEWTLTKPMYENAVIKIAANKKVKLSNLTNEEKSHLGFPNRIEIENTADSKIIVPVIVSNGRSFENQAKIAIQDTNEPNESDQIFYSIGNAPFAPYTNSLQISESTQICAYIAKKGISSDTICGSFIKKPNNYTVRLFSKYNPQYSAGGPNGLVDGIRGTANWRKGDWQGYQGENFEAVVDLQQIQSIHKISVGFLQDSPAWILMPAKVDYFVSNDGINFKFLKSVESKSDPHSRETLIENLTAMFNNISARYIKVIGYNFGKLPVWHQGSGGEAFVFVDEISIE